MGGMGGIGWHGGSRNLRRGVAWGVEPGSNMERSREPGERDTKLDGRKPGGGFGHAGDRQRRNGKQGRQVGRLGAGLWAEGCPTEKMKKVK